MRDTAADGPATFSTPMATRCAAPHLVAMDVIEDVSSDIGAIIGLNGAGRGDDGDMTRNETIFAALSLALAFLAGMTLEDSILNLVLGALIVGFAVGRNRARKEEGRGLGRYFGEVLAFGLVAGLAATAGAGLSGAA